MELSIQHVSKSYQKGKVKALNDFSAHLTEGVYGFLGPNGAGKSTLMNIITDNIRPDQGTVSYDDVSIVSLGKEYRSILGYMPQQQGAYTDFSGIHFLKYMATVKGLSKKETKERIHYVLQITNLQDAAYKKIGAYSGGMRQRILLAQALLNDPKVLILDEPTAGLDPRERVRIRNFISEIALNKIILLATHVVSDVECIAKEIILIKQGALLMKRRPSEILSELRGKVFEVMISEDKLHQFQQQYCISNIHTEPDGIRLRIVADEKPPNEWAPIVVSPNMEDIYLYLFQS